MEKLITRAVERLYEGKDGLYLIVSLPENFDKEKLKKSVKILAKKYRLKKENIVIEEDKEGNTFGIPIGFLIKKENYDINLLTTFEGYEMKKID